MPNLSNVITAGEKKYGKGTFLKANSAPRDFPRIPTGIFALDFCIGGGAPVGSTSSYWGPPGCIAHDTLIGINRGKRNGPRYYPISELYLKFHGLEVRGAGNYQKWDQNIPTRALSLREDSVNYNEVENIIYSGKQQTYKICVKGAGIKVTAIHPFKVPEGTMDADTDGFKMLKHLKIGDIVLCRRDVPLGSIDIQRKRRKSVSGIIYHPYAWSNIVGGFNYKAIHYARLVIEAAMNNIEIDYFISILRANAFKSKTLYFLPSMYQVHHKDGDSENDSFDNLEVLTLEEHSRIHGDSARFYNQHVYEKTILSIEKQEIEDTYDIIMKAPHHNFVANGFIVHNTSKTYIAQKMIVQSNLLCHRCYNYEWGCKCKEKPLKLKTLFIDAEGSFDWGWAEDIGVPEDTDIVYGLTGEEYVDIYHSAIRAEDVGLIILDSIADLTPNAEMAGSAEDNYVMTQARLVSYMIRKGKTLLMKERKIGHRVAVLMLNQIRAKPARPGSPSEEAPGGNASKHDFTLSARTGRRAVLKKDSTGLPEHTLISVSLGSAASKKKLLVLAGAAEFTVVTSNEHEFRRGTVMDWETALNKATEFGLVSEGGAKKYSYKGTDYTKSDILSLFRADKEVYYSLQKQIIDKAKSAILNRGVT